MKPLWTTICLLIAFQLSLLHSQTPEKKQYRAFAIDVAPTIDGKLDDEAWTKGIWLNDFIQHEPYNGAASSQKTEFMILFDDDNIYAAFKAYDSSPDSIVRRLTRRDNIDGDLVGLAFDSYFDKRTAFLFGVSAGGVRWDQMMTENGDREDLSWDPNWWVKVSVNREGWVAEMKIPFSQLRFSNNGSDTWGLEVFRTTYRNDETSFWQHIPKDAPGIVHLFGEMTGMGSIQPKKTFDATPYTVAKIESYEAQSGNPFADGKDFKANAGLDAKIGVTNNLTLDLSINPDFGQVEADPSEVNLSAYETFFQEKRPFFIEGANITNFGIGIGDGGVGNDNLFYSRRIGRRPTLYPNLESGEYAKTPTFTPILGAAKLTGKTSNGLSIGFIESVTAEEKAEIDNDGQRRKVTIEPMTNYFIGRVQKDYDEGNTIIGGMLTSTNRFLDENLEDSFHNSAYSGGIDFTKYIKNKVWMFNVNAAFSQVNGTEKAIQATQRSSARYFQRPDNDYVDYDPTKTSLSGSGGRLQLIRQKGHWTSLGAVLWKTPGFELNDVGYLRQTDQLFYLFWTQYRQWQPKGIYQEYNVGGDFYTVTDFGGNILGKGIEGNGFIQFKNFWRMFGGFNVQFNGISNQTLRGGPRIRVPGSVSGRLNLNTDGRKKLSFNAHFGTSSGFYNSAHDISVHIGANYKPLNTLSLSVNPGISKSFSELQYVTQKTFNGQDRYIFGGIDRNTFNASFRVNFNLTPDLTLQYWGQPFIATGKYKRYKYISDPMAETYAGRYKIYNYQQLKIEDYSYQFDENKDGVTDYSFNSRDFNFKEFLSNLVLRWEYNPGSSVYLVWNQSRSGFNSSGELNLGDDLEDLFSKKPYNIFLLKFSYRIGI
jgi:hypothetical protein